MSPPQFLFIKVACNCAGLGGQVLISDSTAAELGEEFALETLEPMALKGKSEPQPVFAATLRGSSPR